MSDELTVSIVDFESLSDVEKMGASNNGCGKEYANYIRVRHNGETIFFASDAMEPEDCLFSRNLNWIVGALRKCYELGQSDAALRALPGEPPRELSEELIRDAANELDQLFRQRHTIKEVEYLLRKLLRESSSRPDDPMMEWVEIDGVKYWTQQEVAHELARLRESRPVESTQLKGGDTTGPVRSEQVSASEQTNTEHAVTGAAHPQNAEGAALDWPKEPSDAALHAGRDAMMGSTAQAYACYKAMRAAHVAEKEKS